MPSNYKDIYYINLKAKELTISRKKNPNVLVTISFVDIFIFLKGLLDGKGCILNTIYKCFGNFVTLFSYFTSFNLKTNE